MNDMEWWIAQREVRREYEEERAPEPEPEPPTEAERLDWARNHRQRKTYRNAWGRSRRRLRSR